jgi:hypothetical protein
VIGLDVEIVEIDRAEIVFEPWRWAFAHARRDDIDRHFAERQRTQPALWNGHVLLLHRYAIRDGVVHGACFETDYASFLAWRAWGFPDAGVFNIFASAALHTADGAYLVGEMAPSTSSAGAIYFPCGTPDRDDISAGMLDLDASVGRELHEETGLDIGTFDAAPGWVLVRDGNYVALMKKLAARETAEMLRARVLRYLAGERQPEFSDIRIVRRPADFVAAMPRFLTVYLEKAWAR